MPACICVYLANSNRKFINDIILERCVADSDILIGGQVAHHFEGAHSLQTQHQSLKQTSATQQSCLV